MALNNTKVSIYLTRPQMEFLRAEAARLGLSVPELLRRIVDQYRQNMGSH